MDGVMWHQSRCIVVGTLIRWHQVAPIVLVIATSESKHAASFLCNNANKALYDEFKFEWRLYLLMQDNAMGRSGGAVVVFGFLIVVFCCWHVQRSLHGCLKGISEKKHRALIHVALNTLHWSWSTMIFIARWTSLNQYWAGYAHYLHHALTEYIG